MGEPPRRILTRTDATKAVLLPPAGPLWLSLLGLVLAAAGWATAGLAALAVGVVALYLLSLPWIGGWLLARLDRFAALDPSRADLDAEATALVVLDAGRRLDALEYGGDALKTTTLERLAYAAWLDRRLRLPVLASGNGAGPLMSTFLKDLFGVTVRWIEPGSRNTHESALETARLLRRDGFGRIVLVTHYWHMPRAVAAFAGAGLEVVAAPMGFARRRDMWESGGMALVPSVTAIGRSHLALHEAIGLIWYRWRYGLESPAGATRPTPPRR